MGVWGGGKVGALWEVRGRRPNREGVQAVSGSGAGECGWGARRQAV